MSVVRYLRERGVRDWSRLGEALLLHVVVNIGLRTVRYPRLKSSLERFVPVSRRTRSSVVEITSAVRATGRRISRTTCLADALVAHAMLRRHGHEPILRIGVRQSDGSVLDAHAWVECNGAVVMGELPEMAAYAVLA